MQRDRAVRRSVRGGFGNPPERTTDARGIGTFELMHPASERGGSGRCTLGLPAGSALRVRATDALIAASRRHNGLPHHIAVFEGQTDEAIGGMYVHAGEELQIILFDLGAPEVRAMIKEAELTQSLRVLLQSDSGDRRLMLPPYADGVDMLVAAARNACAMETPLYISAMAAALCEALSPQTFEALGLDATSLRAIEMSHVVTDTIAANMERWSQGPLALN